MNPVLKLLVASQLVFLLAFTLNTFSTNSFAFGSKARFKIWKKNHRPTALPNQNHANEAQNRIRFLDLTLDFENSSVPYRKGGTSPEKGFDCSGFVQFIINSFLEEDLFVAGKKRLTSSNAKNEWKGYEVSCNEAKDGDFIVWHSIHMGIITDAQNTLFFTAQDSDRGLDFADYSKDGYQRADRKNLLQCYRNKYVLGH